MVAHEYLQSFTLGNHRYHLKDFAYLTGEDPKEHCIWVVFLSAINYVNLIKQHLFDFYTRYRPVKKHVGNTRQ